MLPKTAEYALRAVVWLGGTAQQPASAERLAEVTKIPRRYLHKVLQDLARSGLVRSQSGPGGGYSLAKEADEITLLDVINAVAPLERIRRCPLGIAEHRQLCPLHAELDRAYAASEEAFSRVTIAQLTASTRRRAALCQTCED
jgi:Rrf2 family protein